MSEKGLCLYVYHFNSNVSFYNVLDLHKIVKCTEKMWDQIDSWIRIDSFIITKLHKDLNMFRHVATEKLVRVYRTNQ